VILIVAGVAGSGKTTIGRLIASKLGWQFADGRLLPIDEYDTLFNLIGTTYGGDGQQTFGLPDLQGRVPMHVGTGSDGGTVTIGEPVG